MKTAAFVGRDMADAVGQARARLGPDALVLGLRLLRPAGVARLWRRPQVELTAGVPEISTAPAATSAPHPGAAQAALAFSRAPAEPAAPRPCATSPDANATSDLPKRGTVRPLDGERELEDAGHGPFDWHWRLLQGHIGLMPLHVAEVLEGYRSRYGEAVTNEVPVELGRLGEILTGFWRPLADTERQPRGGVDVLIGPPGSGKTTVLCKWLADRVLIGRQSLKVWRLDGRVANVAETLSVYTQALGVPEYRQWPGQATPGDKPAGFIDLPGVNPADRDELDELMVRLREWGEVRLHLVLNAVYRTPLLLAQARAFAALPVHDLILTHLDEEPVWARMWDLVLGTNYSIRFWGAGQNIPGGLHPAEVWDLTAPFTHPDSGAFPAENRRNR